MPFAAITYDIKPGHEDDIVAIFSDFERVRSARVDNGDGSTPTSKILSTALFIRDATMVRVIEYEGDLEAVARFMARQPAVRKVEERLAPFVNSPRHTDTEDGFVATFRASLLRCVMQLSVRDLPAST
jgi:hypothetical protein